MQFIIADHPIYIKCYKKTYILHFRCRPQNNFFNSNNVVHLLKIKRLGGPLTHLGNKIMHNEAHYKTAIM